MPLTPRDDDILSTLSRRVRMLTLAQIAEIWWTATVSGRSAARRRLQALRRAGLLAVRHVLARPLPSIEQPLFAWKPGEAPPDYGPLAWRLQSRWTSQPRRTSVFIATKRAANQCAGRACGVIKQHFQATHDLGVAQMYLCLRRKQPQSAEQWMGEDLLRLARRREKVPDAALACDHENRICRVLEFGGAYDSVRLRQFHQDCARRQLPYEIW